MDDQSPTGLPASIEAWGVRTRPNKGPRPALSLERIVAAAVRVATTDGLQAVSMGRVAADLGVSTMSLYRYVAAKDELLALMADLSFEAPPAARRPEETWRDGLSRWAWSELGVYRRNPWVLRIPISGPPVTPNAMAWLERGLDCLGDTGLPEGEKLSVMLLLTGFVRSQATLPGRRRRRPGVRRRPAGPGADGRLRAADGQADRPGAVPGAARRAGGRGVRRAGRRRLRLRLRP